MFYASIVYADKGLWPEPDLRVGHNRLAKANN